MTAKIVVTIFQPESDTLSIAKYVKSIPIKKYKIDIRKGEILNVH